MTLPVSFQTVNNIGVINIDYPPVNALSRSVRQGLVDGIARFEQDESIDAIIIRCEKRTFIAGADIKEFAQAPLEPHLPDVVNRIEACSKPVIASLFGTSLGGGFEIALACHFRVALESAKVGLPEVNLGLIPGAGGTQRLPRIVGITKALQMITSGKHYSVKDFSKFKLFDQIFSANDDLNEATIEFIENRLTNGSLKISRVGEQTMIDDVDNWQQTLDKIRKRSRGKDAPNVAAQILLDTRSQTILEGMAVERKEFIKLKESEQSEALRFAFAAERQASKTDFNDNPLPIKSVGVVGGGTMGSGIATAFLSAGFDITLIEQNEPALELGKQRIESNFSINVKRGRMNQTQVEGYLASLTTSVDYQSLSHCDLVIEAVFENMEVKKTIFKQFDQVCKPDCILATNTSYLDIDEIASVVRDPSRVIGMHFFSPANIMKLLEVVQAKESSEQALVTAMSIAKKLNKISVLVGVCFGFAGNRMYTRYGREVQQMLLEGATVSQVDNALTSWGMAMGPLAVADMSGLDIGYHARSSQPFPEYDKGYFKPAELMYELSRYGRKTGNGYYDYDDKGMSKSDPLVDELISKEASKLGILQREFSDNDIAERAILALISEGLQLLKDSIVKRASDIDVIWLHGYGFPRHKGGPMFQAKQMGKNKLESELKKLRTAEGDRIWPNVDVDQIF
ncbi:MAG: 3-hydroxyacyl-CoA dehydrogenase NAD-binding domain-containing protein [Kangiellaceae bacterium]|nr:3-hydroxyacyl-CoA dehydrogenase NAD-binding domain-containing protein [Kangiellaceae bacterium]